LTRMVIRLSVLSTASTFARSLRLPRLAAINSTLRGVDGADAGRGAGDQRETLGILAHLSVS
jgi:hypothetical protein